MSVVIISLVKTTTIAFCSLLFQQSTKSFFFNASSMIIGTVFCKSSFTVHMKCHHCRVVYCIATYWFHHYAFHVTIYSVCIDNKFLKEDFVLFIAKNPLQTSRYCCLFWSTEPWVQTMESPSLSLTQSMNTTKPHTSGGLLYKTVMGLALQQLKTNRNMVPAWLWV